MLSDIGPYKYQRNRQLGNKQPRPPQAAFQPNQLPALQGFGMNTMDYWQGVLKDYLRKRKTLQSITPKVGRI